MNRGARRAGLNPDRFRSRQIDRFLIADIPGGSQAQILQAGLDHPTVLVVRSPRFNDERDAQLGHAIREIPGPAIKLDRRDSSVDRVDESEEVSVFNLRDYGSSPTGSGFEVCKP